MALSAQIGYIVPEEYDLGPGAIQIHHTTMKLYNKPRKSLTLFGLGFLETIPSPSLEESF